MFHRQNNASHKKVCHKVTLYLFDAFLTYGNILNKGPNWVKHGRGRPFDSEGGGGEGGAGKFCPDGLFIFSGIPRP